MKLAYRLGEHDEHQGLYFLGNYVKDRSGRWRRPTFEEVMKHRYTPAFIDRMIGGRAVRMLPKPRAR